MTRRIRLLLALACLASPLAACGDDPAPTDGGTDAGTDGGEPPDPNRLELPNLDGAVEVVYDDRGVPHIYATTRHDLLVVEGYLMSRDRFAQMEFIRRSVLGTLSEVTNADQLQSDRDARWEGYRRLGEEIYESLPADDPTRLTAEAFVEGINYYVDAVERREEDPAVEGAEIINIVLVSPNFGHWAPADVFALARYQAANLSFDPRDDLNRSRRLAAVLDAFPSDATDPRFAARAGLYSDLYGQSPAREVYTRDGFNDGTTAAILPRRPGFGPGRPGAGGGERGPAFVPDVRSIDGAMPFLDRIMARGERIFGDLVTRGSNNWTVAGSLTASGHPILANDPHLSLISPPVWWYVHLNTARMGGEDMIDAEGVAFAGLPGVVLGFNRHIAWGATTTGYDVTDGYQEQITGAGACDAMGDVIGGTVLFMGAQREIAFHEETIRIGGGDPVTVRFAYPTTRPGSQFLPGSCVQVEGTTDQWTAISVRYTGWEPSNELAYFTGLLTATDVEEARAAQDAFEVGSQNFQVVDVDDIFWSTQSRIPQRDDRATDYMITATGVPSGHCPHMLLPGTGEYEWVGDLDEAFIPHDLDPARGWIATANQDNVGVTDDGNPCNDPYYLGAGFDFGWREARIQERLEALAARGDITTADMIDLQAETQSPLGRTLRDPIVAILADPASAMPGLSSADLARLADAHDRLAAWTLETPHAIGSTDAAEIADSVATAIFNASITRIIPLALEDEMMAMGMGSAPTSESARLLEWMMNTPERLFTYEPAISDSVLWDDLRTEPAVETKEEIVIRGVLAGLDFLAGALGTDAAEWRWGRLHTVRFAGVPPALGGLDRISIPPSDDPTYPDGFPRHGDWGNVDPGNYGLWNTTRFSFGSGASQRLVVEMLPEGPRAFNAIPGGQSIDPASPHKDDEAMLWIRNEQPPLYFTESDVQAHAERTLTVVSP